MPETNSLDQLGIRIDKGEEVSAEDVSKAFENEKKTILKKYEELGIKDDSFESKQYLERLTALKERLLRELEELKTSKEKGKVKAISEAMALRDSLKGHPEEMKKKHEDVERVLKKAREITDPDSSSKTGGLGIPDYEGWDAFWETGMEDENKNNKTRWTLSGWLAALELEDPSLVQAELAKARKIYDDSWGFWDWDASLDYEPMVKGMKMQQYLGQISQFKLAPEAEGFVAGLLHVAHTLMPQEEEAYRTYLISTLGGMHGSGDLNYTPKKGEVAAETGVYNKGVFQLQKLEAIRSPKEWMERNKKLRDDFDSLKQKAYGLSEALGFNYADVQLRTFLAKDKEQISINDEPEMIYAMGQIRTEAYTHVVETKKTLEGIREGMGKTLDEMIEKNKPKERYTDADFEDIRRRFTEVDEQIAKVTVAETDGLDLLAGYKDPINNAVGLFESLQKKIDEMNAEIDKAPEKQPEPEPDKGSGAAGGAGAGVAGGGGSSGGGEKPETQGETPAEKKENVETGDLEQFLVARNLFEARKGDEYVYMLGRIRPQVDFGNTEGPGINFYNDDVNRLVGPQLRTFFGSLHGQIDIPDAVAKLEHARLSASSLEDMLKKMAEAVKTMVPAEKMSKLRKISDIMSQAFIDSSLNFSVRPSRRAMEVEYNRKFISAWERAGKELDKLTGDIDTGKGKKKEIKPEDIVPPGNRLPESMPIPPELNFLGPVYLLYTDALSALVLHGNDPDGVAFTLPWENKPLGMRFKFEGRGYSLNYPGGKLSYPSIEAAARDINSGHLHQVLMQATLLNEKKYEPYKDQIGSVDDLDKGRVPGEVYLELDWNNPDPDIYMTAQPHGHIAFTVGRENVGPYGEEHRSGWAEDFSDFVKQLKHIRQWAEQKDHPRTETVAARREVRFDAIVNPYSWRNLSMETKIGRVVSFNLYGDEKVQMYLDWGGGNAANARNAMLTVWVGSDGALRYRLAAPGTKVGETRAVNFDDLVRQVVSLRAGKNLERPPSVADAGGSPEAEKEAREHAKKRARGRGSKRS